MRELVTVFLAVSVLAILVLPGLEAASPRLIHSSILARPSILASPSLDRPCHPWLLVPRGGDGSDDVDNESDEEGEEEEDEEEEEEEEVEIDVEYDEEEDDDVAMVKSAVKATEKLQAKKTAVTKKEVSAKLSAPKKKGPSLMKRYVPYIVRACLTPAILFAMTKAYFQSLFNLDFLAEDSSQGLRSALEEKAKKSGSAGGGRKGKRTMKPGQAKTLSDLPQLST